MAFASFIQFIFTAKLKLYSFVFTGMIEFLFFFNFMCIENVFKNFTNKQN